MEDKVDFLEGSVLGNVLQWQEIGKYLMCLIVCIVVLLLCDS